MDHGLDFSNPVLTAWTVGIPLFHLVVVLSFRFLGVLPNRAKKGCRESDIVAFCLVAAVVVTFCAAIGCIGIYDVFDVIDNKNIFVDKFYSESTFVTNYLVIPMLVYQIWNLTVTIILSDLRTPDAIGHHIVTGLLAYFGLWPYGQYYALFYFGVAELTSIPLNLVDIFKYLPQLAETYPTVNSFAKGSFIIGFFVIRIIIWPVVSYELFFGCLDLIMNKTAHSNFVVGFFLFANTFLTFLQFYWGFLIAKKLLKMSKSKKKSN